MKCEMCQMFEDLIKEIQPDEIVYSQYTPLATAMKKVLEGHKERVHNPEDEKARKKEADQVKREMAEDVY